MDQRTTPFTLPLRNLSLIIGIAFTVMAQPATADQLVMRPDINHAKPGTKYYVHGLSMAQVAKKFGQPSKKLAPVPLKGTTHQPPITRWIYPEFTVYFERGVALHLVTHHRIPE